ncbi:hypothetical protein BD626DRAFT_486235 [Schizophyllum amplum]|uniref:RRM domain-containing protein n=1 Tax=Schizophyllum amplum TaxID=97359 RepID=A0A550CM83_9AGAR|nr:hypothetical protein BD626DRAFT_486235 [Auriculariopsis ampla]
MSTDAAKLSKKQKKALAFRDRKKGGKDRPEQLDVPEDDIAHDEDTLEAPSGKGKTPDKAPKSGKAKQPASAGPSQDGARKGRASAGEPSAAAAPMAPAASGDLADREVAPAAVAGKKKGKKRAEDGAGMEGGLATKEDGAKAARPKKRKRDEEAVDGDEAEPARPEKKVKQRLILFVGNLKFTTSKEAIQKHFSACEPPPDVRLLTPKSAKPGIASAKSKGCAFLEFQNKGALQEALKLHQSELEGRFINVELTAGGGGKSDARLEKLKQRNKEMLTRRTKKAAKGNKGDTPAEPERPQRYSATSGMEHIPLKNRTWSVPDADEGDGTHRGGQKHTRGKKRSKAQSTGMNAIPIGSR